jgi:hypothetical protein
MPLPCNLLILFLCAGADAGALDSGSSTAPNDLGKTEVQMPESLEVEVHRLRTRHVKLGDQIAELNDKLEANRGKPTAADEKTALALADKEHELVQLSDRVLKVLKKGQYGVAFAEVFQQLRDDMSTVEMRLRKMNTGMVTMSIENDIIATLEDLIDALEKSHCKDR